MSAIIVTAHDIDLASEITVHQIVKGYSQDTVTLRTLRTASTYTDEALKAAAGYSSRHFGASVATEFIDEHVAVVTLWTD